MQPRLPSELVRAVITAKGNPLPQGRDSARPEANVPAGVFVHEQGPGSDGSFRTAPSAADVVTIEVMWKSQPWRWWIVAGFVVCGLAAAGVLSAKLFVGGAQPIPAKAFPVFGLALLLTLGVGLFVYEQLGRLLNKTRLRLDGRTLQVKHSPLPWAGNKTLPRERIRKLFCVDDRGVIRVLADLDVGETWILRSTTTIGLTWDQAHYVVERLGVGKAPGQP
ncbi:MAG: hypothetical protein HY898_30225 [Deltaproteobacteria bacterium]|nr:hypothetical protein [Deltaproteobacteria bacterium]